ncbi:guanine deaminase [Streptomyces sp. ISL-96]|uniref:guanine deaminase n=1 Tax=Streptomyces sp. ISL-96 TaxID=2819191 RepID=UPI0027E2FE35|nr:guanine deaminase [Streptomyces sp. ISL-96]
MSDEKATHASGPGRRSLLAGMGAAAVPAMALSAPSAAHAIGRAVHAPPRTGQQQTHPTVVFGHVLHFLEDPGDPPDPTAWELFEDGALAIGGDGTVTYAGPASDLPERLRRGARTIDHRGRLIVPGFVDTHIHAAQVDVIASYGKQLLEWLETYVFPAEARFDRAAHARALAGFFLDRLLAAGTTTATVFPTIHPASVDAFFEQSLQRGLRMLCGKVLMDREPYAPAYLRDRSVAEAEQQTRELIGRWHGKERLGYSVTPRFAPTSTEPMLAMTGRLLEEHPDLWLQTHAAENKDEVALVKKLFGGRSYIDVYERYGLLTKRSLFAHCVHIDATDRARLAAAGSSVAFCPTSNLFLGSGLFDLHAARKSKVSVGLGTDVGAGTSYSLLTTLNEAYKVTALRGRTLSAYRGFYLATLGGAQALDLDDTIGNFRPGKEADFTVLDFTATETLARRTDVAKDFAERLFALMILGDERAVAATYAQGRLVHDRDNNAS